MTGAGPALVVVGTPIGNLGDLSPRAVAALEGADVIACEDTRRTRALLSAAAVSMATKRLLAVHEHNEAEQAAAIVALLGDGRRVALVTDAGMPAVSDPGRRVVHAAVTAGHRVEVVPGPSALVAAVAASGLRADRFVFEGFLPRRGRERKERLRTLGAERRAVVLYEAPHRVAATVDDLRAACGPDRAVALARELTKLHEEVWRGTLDGAVAHLAASTPRGEYVVVVEGAPEPPPATDEDIERALTVQLRAGQDRRSAVAAVAGELAVARRRVYELAVRLERDTA